MPVGVWHPGIRRGNRTHRASTLVTQAGSFEEGGQNVTLILSPKRNAGNQQSSSASATTAAIPPINANSQKTLSNSEEKEVENDPMIGHSVEARVPNSQPAIQDSTPTGNEGGLTANEGYGTARNGMTSKKRGILSFFGIFKKDKVLDHIVSTQSKIEVDYHMDQVHSTAKGPRTEAKIRRQKRPEKGYSKHQIISTSSEIEVAWKPRAKNEKKNRVCEPQGKIEAGKTCSLESGKPRQGEAPVCKKSTEKHHSTNVLYWKQRMSFLLRLLESAKGTELDQLTEIISTYSKIEADLRGASLSEETTLETVQSSILRSQDQTDLQHQSNAISEQHKSNNKSKKKNFGFESQQGLLQLIRIAQPRTRASQYEDLFRIISTYSKIEVDGQELPSQNIFITEDRSTLGSEMPPSRLDPKVESILPTGSKIEVNLDDSSGEAGHSEVAGADSELVESLLQLVGIVQSPVESSEIAGFSEIFPTQSKIEVDWTKSKLKEEFNSIDDAPENIQGDRKLSLPLAVAVSRQDIASVAATIRQVACDEKLPGDAAIHVHKIKESKSTESLCMASLKNAIEPDTDQPLQNHALTLALHEEDFQQKTPVRSSSESSSGPEVCPTEPKIEDGLKKRTKTPNSMGSLGISTTAQSCESSSMFAARKDHVESLSKTLKLPSTKSIEDDGPSLILPPVVVARLSSESNAQPDSNRIACGEGFKLESCAITERQSELRENICSNKSTCRSNSCTPAGSTLKEGMLSTLGLPSFIASPTSKMEFLPTCSKGETVCKIAAPFDLNKQSEKEQFSNNGSLVILGLEDTHSIENSVLEEQTTPQPEREHNVETVSPVEEAPTIHVLPSTSFLRPSERAFGVGGIAGARDSPQGYRPRRIQYEVPSRHLRKLWVNTPPERQEQWLAALIDAIEGARQEQATRDDHTMGTLSEILEDSFVEGEDLVAELHDQHQDDDDVSVSSLDLLWNWLTCRKLEATPQRRKLETDQESVVVGNETEDLDMLIDLLAADMPSAGASGEEVTVFPVAPECANPVSPKRARTNAELRIVKSI